MRSEARLASTVHHPGVAQIYDYDDSSTTHGGMAFIVMELVEGRSLAQVLREEGRLPVDQVMSVVQQVADALAEKVTKLMAGTKYGDPSVEQGLHMGPLVTRTGRDNMAAMVESAKAQGAQVLTGGRDGRLVQYST